MAGEIIPGIQVRAGETLQLHNAIVDPQRGLERINEMAAQFDPADIEALRRDALTSGMSNRPFHVIGAGELGLTSMLAMIEARAFSRGLAIFHEPPSFVDNSSPKRASQFYFTVARIENALALTLYAAQRGIEVAVNDIDVLIADGPKSRRPLPKPLVEAAQWAGPNPLVLNTVAFARHMGPASPDVEVPPSVLSINMEGGLSRMNIPPFNIKQGEATLASMGYNDEALRMGYKEAGLLGSQKPEDVDASWVFPTWPGGSRHALIDFTPGVYNRGRLGQAKMIAENAAIRWNMDPALATQHGMVVILDLPAFLSGALGAIPGGFRMYFLSRQVLEEKGMFLPMSKLAPQSLSLILDRGFVRQNPLAFVQTDMYERANAGLIMERLGEFERRVAAYRESHPDAPETLSPEAAHEILMHPTPLVPGNYRDVLGVMRAPEQVVIPTLTQG